MDALSVTTTGLAILALTGAQVEERADHAVVRSPRNPLFWWGNYIQELPGARRAPEEWLDLFEAEFPAARHVAVGLTQEPDIEAWAAAGRARSVPVTLEADAEDVLVLRDATPRRVPLATGYAVRQVTADAEWAAVLDNRVAMNARSHEHPHAEHLRYETAAVAAARGLVAAGRAAWFGAFAQDGRLAAQMGIVDLGRAANGSHLARYQTVITEPEHRRRGLASHLLGAAAGWARTRGADTLVICADADSAAGRTYRSLGFSPAAREHGVAGARLARPTASA